jgi:hypothetical protein
MPELCDSNSTNIAEHITMPLAAVVLQNDNATSGIQQAHANTPTGQFKVCLV